MITHSTDYVEYCRQVANGLKNVQDLALRGAGKEPITTEIQRKTLEVVGLVADDELVDIGCGDGTLLRMAKDAGVRSAIGLLATEEEVGVVQRLGFNVLQGLTDNLPLPDESASVVVCNSVLLVVPRNKIQSSLCEIRRIAKPGARIYLGEIPFVAGHVPKQQSKGAWETLSDLYREHGLRTWFGMLRRMIYWKLTGRPMIVYEGAAISFYALPEEFIAMAHEARLRLVRYWQHDYPNTRNNYLFTRD
jgi:ubiquinone/menaquinone biosynthesis C-methylase UbiE